MSKKKILLPLDGSPFSHYILSYISDLFRPDDTELMFLRVTSEPSGLITQPITIGTANWLLPQHLPVYDSAHDAAWASHPIYASQEAERVRAQMLDELQSLAYQFQETGYHTSVTVKFGNPADEICDVVKQSRIDLIAMATHARSGIGHLMLGSVAEEVLRRVDIPVLLVHPGVFVKETDLGKQNDQVIAPAC